jgi:hypothetical protein
MSASVHHACYGSVLRLWAKAIQTGAGSRDLTRELHPIGGTQPAASWQLVAVAPDDVPWLWQHLNVFLYVFV